MGKDIFFDFARSCVDAADIDAVYLANYPEEAKWAPLVAVELYEYGRVDIPGDVPWIDHLKDIPPIPEGLDGIIKSAAKTSGAAIAVTGSRQAIVSAKAGLGFFKENQKPEILFLAADSQTYQADMKKLENLDFYICNINSADSSKQESSVLSEVLPLLRKKYGDESRLLNFDIADSASSILSPASLFLLSARGVNINEIAAGARLEPVQGTYNFVPQACGDIGTGKEHLLPASYIPAKYYTIIRSMMLKQGKSDEIILWLDPRFEAFALWLKYLFDENPTGLSVVYEKLLPGSAVPAQNFFETILDFGDNASTEEGQNNKTLITEISRKRSAAGSPILRVELPDGSPHSYGRLVALFSRGSRMLWK
ncbi:MAG: hypothetical protein FWG13_01890 [Leptospirales bacterium]|nr:hypothetical protein [Leptospirales bacterium]